MIVCIAVVLVGCRPATDTETPEIPAAFQGNWSVTVGTVTTTDSIDPHEILASLWDTDTQTGAYYSYYLNKKVSSDATSLEGVFQNIQSQGTLGDPAVFEDYYLIRFTVTGSTLVIDSSSGYATVSAAKGATLTSTVTLTKN
jgi:hypothetical protein